MKYICSWSGGKDSTASIILAHENNEPLDVIVFAEVMFDKKENISGENPDHIHFVKNIAKPLFESWGYEVLILRSDKDYLDTFYHVIENPRKHMWHKGMYFGFPTNGRCGVKRDCKEKPIKQFYKSIKDPYQQYVGICIDEPKRLESMHKDPTKVSLLEKYEYTEQMAKELCLQYGLLSPCYELSNRGGCWFCPNAKFAEHKRICECDRRSWKRFVALEQECNIANAKWNVYGETLAERNKNIEKEIQNQNLLEAQMRKYGEGVYDSSKEIKREDIGIYVCPTCHKPSRLIHQKGCGFQNILSICESGHTCEIAKEIYEKYHVGDRVRLYESTFGKDAVLRLDSYKEGVVVRSYPDLIDYRLDFKVDKCVMNGEDIKDPAWVIGSICHGVGHSCAEVKLLEKAKETVYEQLSFFT